MLGYDFLELLWCEVGCHGRFQLLLLFVVNCWWVHSHLIIPFLQFSSYLAQIVVAE